jgi:adenylate cyclase
MGRFAKHLAPLALLAAGLALRMADPPALEDARLRVFDHFQALRPRPYVPAPVRVVDIDEESLDRLGQWPWPRDLVARLAGRLREHDAAALAFDVVFAEPDRTSLAVFLRGLKGEAARRALSEAAAEGASLDHDEALAAVIAGGRAVTGFALVERSARADPAVKAGFAFAGQDPLPFAPRFAGAVASLPPLEAAAAGNGALNVIPDRDGVVRRLPLVLASGDRLHPSLALEALRVAQGARGYAIKSTDAHGVPGFGAKTGISSLKVGDFVAPTDANGQLWLYDTGAVPDRSIPAWQVLADGFDGGAVAGAIVFVGSSAVGLHDLRATPLSGAAPGVTLHAQAAEQILLGAFLHRPDWATGAEVVFLLVVGLALVAALPRLGALASGAVGAASLALALAASWFAFAETGLLFEPIYPALVVLLVYLASSLVGYLATERERQRVRGAFSRYLAPALVERLAASSETLRLGGETRDMTILFCDIRGFTALSERLDAAALTHLVNRFFTPMSAAILEHGGTVDKFIGDCVMAFWNAPLDDPEHARHACRAALDMAARMEPLNRELAGEAEAANRPFIPVRIGIGLNTGACCVGNLGSEQRFDYSVIGDPVNIASRFEGLTKTYGVEIVIGESTRGLAPEFAAVELDLVLVAGKSTPVRVYALVGDADVAAGAAFRALAAEHAEMLDAYRARRFAEAAGRLARCQEIGRGFELDRVWRLYDDRIHELAKAPPDRAWNGVYASAKG